MCIYDGNVVALDRFTQLGNVLRGETLFTNIVAYSQDLLMASRNSELSSFFNPPSTQRQVSPLISCDDRVEAAFEGCNYGDECANSSMSTLCGTLGFSTPRSPTSLQVKKSGTCGNEQTCVKQDAGSRNNQMVFVWDLDETLIIFQTLIDGQYVQLFDGFKDNHMATLLGRRWEKLILEVCDDYFFYKEVEQHYCSNVQSLQEYETVDDNNFKSSDDLQNVRHLYRQISQLYGQGLQTLLNPEQVEEWANLYEATDIFTNGWLSAGRQKLEEFQRVNEQATSSDRGAHEYNFLVTSGALVPSLVKCLLFKLNPYFHPSNVFSSREDGKLQCCRWIRDRFLMQSGGYFPKFCVIGDGVDEEEAARVLGWPFLKVNIDPETPDQLPMLSLNTIEKHIKPVQQEDEDGLNSC